VADEQTPSATLTLQQVWAKLMTTMGGTNLQRARDARRAAHAIRKIGARR
jgi:hypothetical protein